MSSTPTRVVFANTALCAIWLVASANSAPDPAIAVPAAGFVAHDVPAEGGRTALATALDDETRRLHLALTDPPAPRAVARDPFRFGTVPRERRGPLTHVASPIATNDVEPSQAEQSEPFPYQLIGIATSADDAGIDVRRAILSGPHDVIIAVVDEILDARYRVVRVGTDAIEVRQLDADRTIRLVLR